MKKHRKKPLCFNKSRKKLKFLAYIGRIYRCNYRFANYLVLHCFLSGKTLWTFHWKGKSKTLCVIFLTQQNCQNFLLTATKCCKRIEVFLCNKMLQPHLTNNKWGKQQIIRTPVDQCRGALGLPFNTWKTYFTLFWSHVKNLVD